VRYHSQINQKTEEEMDVVIDSIMKHMTYFKVTQLIHGHTHKPGLFICQEKQKEFKRYVLSDWDDRPQLLCYDNTKGLHFVHM
jgi:UDP-2,3-diacylglucosamine hydrolase